LTGLGEFGDIRVGVLHQGILSTRGGILNWSAKKYGQALGVLRLLPENGVRPTALSVARTPEILAIRWVCSGTIILIRQSPQSPGPAQIAR
jgi:hypothetical protein